MRKQFIVFLAVTILTTAILPQKIYANTSATSAALVLPSVTKATEKDSRAVILQKYLEAHNSPLSAYAATFIDEADKNDIDWKMVAAISGVESTFGQHIPAASYNGWGFGVYGDNVRRFSSWEDGIATVSTSLKEDYMDKYGAKDVYQIGRIYAASPTWAYRVQNFMDEIDAYSATAVDSHTLSISL
jgi:hypothetical protein